MALKGTDARVAVWRMREVCDRKREGPQRARYFSSYSLQERHLKEGFDQDLVILISALADCNSAFASKGDGRRLQDFDCTFEAKAGRFHGKL